MEEIKPTNFIRQIIDAGSGFPPHWRGEPTDVNLATATAMERSATQHLRRRQLYLQFLITDLAHTAYTRAWTIGKVRRKPDRDIIEVDTPDVNRQDNRDLSAAALSMAQALQSLQETLDTRSPTLTERMIRLFFRFAGEPLDDDQLQAIAKEVAHD